MHTRFHDTLNFMPDFLYLLQGKINRLSDDLQRLFQKVPKRPRESKNELDEKIRYVDSTTMGDHVLHLTSRESHMSFYFGPVQCLGVQANDE